MASQLLVPGGGLASATTMSLGVGGDRSALFRASGDAIFLRNTLTLGPIFRVFSVCRSPNSLSAPWGCVHHGVSYASVPWSVHHGGSHLYFTK